MMMHQHSSPMSIKRGREDDHSSPTKRSRTHAEFDLQLHAVMPQSSMTDQQQPSLFGQHASAFHFQQHQQQQAAPGYNQGTGMDMTMDEDMPSSAASAHASAAHPWVGAYSNASSVPSSVPNTPLDEVDFQLEDDDDLYGDNTYARPPPCFPSPTEYSQTYTDAHGVTRVFPAPGATDSMDDPNAFAQYALTHGLNKAGQGPQGQQQQSGQAYGWDVPAQSFGSINSHMA
ncbi:hypothetical protein OIV83_003158 [Microbotryomycetes sp. JL201]|nr:hypothetical protein OIV83_003158 [Microbotryomycetes sp. JL201]